MWGQSRLKPSPAGLPGFWRFIMKQQRISKRDQRIVQYLAYTFHRDNEFIMVTLVNIAVGYGITAPELCTIIAQHPAVKSWCVDSYRNKR
jgi:hypothetical protein